MSEPEPNPLMPDYVSPEQEQLRILFLSIVNQAVQDAERMPGVASWFKSKDFQWWVSLAGFAQDYRFKSLVKRANGNGNSNQQHEEVDEHDEHEQETKRQRLNRLRDKLITIRDQRMIGR
jgi:hypothetical protein